MKTLSLKELFAWIALVFAMVLFGFSISLAQTNSDGKPSFQKPGNADLGIHPILPTFFPKPVPNPDPAPPPGLHDSVISVPPPIKRMSEENSVGENISQSNGLEVYPNPNHGQFSVNFNLNGKGTLKVRVMDITGKEIFSRVLEDFTGSYNNLFDLSDKGAGIYILSAEQNNRVYSKKIVIS